MSFDDKKLFPDTDLIDELASTKTIGEGTERLSKIGSHFYFAPSEKIQKTFHAVLMILELANESKKC